MASPDRGPEPTVRADTIGSFTLATPSTTGGTRHQFALDHPVCGMSVRLVRSDKYLDPRTHDQLATAVATTAD